jgi:hypothetical protein
MTWEEMLFKHKQDWREYERFREISFKQMETNHLNVRKHYDDLEQNLPFTVQRSMKHEYEEWIAMWGNEGKRVRDLKANHFFQREHLLKQKSNNTIDYQEIQQSVEELQYYYTNEKYMQFDPNPVKAEGLLPKLKIWIHNIFGHSISHPN